MPTETNILNKAAARIGSESTIISISDKRVDAQYLKIFYEDAIEALLKTYTWQFATAFIPLTRIGDSTTARWAYEYRYPINVVKVFELDYDPSTTNDPPPFQRAYDYENERGLILTNETEPTAVCVYKIMDASQFDISFADTLSWRLAAEVAPNLTSDEKTITKMWTLYERALSRAKAETSSEFAPLEQPDPPWIRNR